MGPGEAIAIPIVIGILFIGLPWLILHYVTQWKRSGGISREDEQLLDELHDTARRLDERLCTIERIMTLENPNWRAVCNDPTPPAIRQERTR
ncbi:MAG: Phage shock protein B [uncultured Sphingomonadaceae bacterium]|uniref:Phage shock protein B n=1 Tax=uncultured Sphingomonadaceae bacterium TaxID=169976 RepID=A0A6J4T8I4_9SPHN|nr:MAG: Phage shock protein B [uncultured Sphingomonadaceae bacterium]